MDIRFFFYAGIIPLGSGQATGRIASCNDCFGRTAMCSSIWTSRREWRCQRQPRRSASATVRPYRKRHPGNSPSLSRDVRRIDTVIPQSGYREKERWIFEDALLIGNNAIVHIKHLANTDLLESIGNLFDTTHRVCVPFHRTRFAHRGIEPATPANACGLESTMEKSRITQLPPGSIAWDHAVQSMRNHSHWRRR